MQSTMKTSENNSKNNGEIKTSEETVMKNPKRFSWKKQKFFKPEFKKFYFIRYKKHFKS